MSYGRLEPMLIEVPTFFDPGRGALSGALGRYAWRQGIENARKYVAQLADFERALRAGQRNTPPQKTASDEMIALVKKEVALRVQADSVDEIRDMIALAKELDYRLVLDSVAEGWLIANELGEADVPVAITPRNRRRPRPGQENTSGSSIESSKIFEQSGVKFAVTALSNSISLNGLAGRDLSSLPLEAAFAIRGGCSESTALAAITIVPARLMGLGNRLGSIEEGKDADLLILNGPPLDYRTYVETALVSGNVSYERAKDRVYPVFERN
jgi:imidazolonepropionase-like amidohydrolase